MDDLINWGFCSFWLILMLAFFSAPWITWEIGMMDPSPRNEPEEDEHVQINT